MAIITLNNNSLSGVTALPAGVGGKVLQVVNGSTSSQIGVTANNSADTGLTATITPSAVSSKILIICNHGLFTKSASTTYCTLALIRNSTTIYYIGNAFYSEESGGGQFRLPTQTMSFLDSPSTTSATTYKTNIACPAGSSGTIYSQYQNQQSTIQLIEIGA
jgi:hypothetical protein